MNHLYPVSQATKLYQFYNDFNFSEEMKNMILGGGLDKSTIWRHKTALKRVGIGISVEKLPESKNILEQLIIPSTNSKFDLIDYQKV